MQKQTAIDSSLNVFWPANLKVIEERWPSLSDKLYAASVDAPDYEIIDQGAQTLVIDGIQLTSSFDRHREAALQATLIPKDSSRAWVYGMALGDLPRQLLKRPRLEQLTVVILNPALALLSFANFDHLDWLSDPRVVLSVAGTGTKPQRPFAAAPGSLLLTAEHASSLRDRLFLELASPFIHRKHQATPRFNCRLETNSKRVAKDGDVAELFDGQKNKTVVVAAAGPTLSDHYHWLKENDLPLVAVDATLKPLLTAGIVPDWVVTIDGHDEIYSRFFHGIDASLLTGVPLVYFPAVATEILDKWPGPRLASYPDTAPYQDMARRFPKAKLFSSGSVLHPAIDLAVRMGANQIILTGADFCFPGGQSHVAGSGALPLSAGSGRHWVMDGFGNRVPTTPGLRGFLRDLEDYLAGHEQILFLSTDRRGAAIERVSYLEDLP